MVARGVGRARGRGDIDAHPVAAAIRDRWLVRYGLPPRALGGLIDARSFDLYDEPMASCDTGALRDADLVGADRACGAHPARRPRSGDRRGRGTCRDRLCDSRLLRALPIHARAASFICRPT
jgi:hypothetical protein